MIQHFTAGEDRALHVSILAAVEVRSAIRRREFNGDADSDSAAVALATLVQETGRIIEHPITAAVIAEASGLVDHHRLRALDALQLASAIICRSSLYAGDDVIFVASDLKLLNAAVAQRFSIWDPATEPAQ